MVASEGHIPVLLAEVLDHLRAREGSQRLLDATFGGGGHTRAFLEAHPGNTVHALDADPEAAARAAVLAEAYPGRFTFARGNFAELAALSEGVFDGILFDLGLSSFHFDTAERGFSFRHDGPLDMRLDPERGEPASAFLEQASADELRRAIRNYGEEPSWRRVVQAIERARGTDALRRTVPFAALVEEALGPAARHRSRIHPATRTFQGIRIAVNRELEVIESALPAAFDRLRSGGRLAVISFHSLEDRIVKRFCRRMAGRPETARDHRAADERTVYARELSRRPLAPGEAECNANPRARSAKLRVLEKTQEFSAA
ncbi:MAG: 16S rRNA (cytosine(1402)-N(4))-methyltransferase RsmH [Verrucomicrobiota bacterium]